MKIRQFLILAAIATIGITSQWLTAQDQRPATNAPPMKETRVYVRPHALIFVFNPEATMAGKSSCEPCNQLIRDLQKEYEPRNGRPMVGLGDDAYFKVVRKAPEMKACPQILYVYPNGKQQVLNDSRSSNHEEVAKRHPLFTDPNGKFGFAGDAEPKPSEQNSTPFKEASLIRNANLWEDSEGDSPPVQTSPTCFVQTYGSYGGGYGAYSSNCAGAASYGAYSSNCNGGGNGGGGYGPPAGGGGGDYYTPSQASYYSPRYQPYYAPAQSAYQPRYAPSYANYAPRSRGVYCVNGQCFSY